MASRHALVAAAPLLLALFAAGAAHADPTPQQKELARDLMQKGRDARGAHDLKLALSSFKAADDIMHVPTTTFELARSQADLGLLVEAHETLLRVGRIPEQASEPKPFQEAREYARVLDQELVGRIPQLRIRIEGGSPDRVASVFVDGQTLPPGALVVPYKVDPGHHVVVAKTDAAEGKQEVDVAERETKDVVVTLKAGAVVASAPPATGNGGDASAATSNGAATAATGASSGEPSADSGPASHSRFTTVTWIGFGVAAAGVVAGSVTGILALSGKSTLSSECNGTRCPPSTQSDLSSANSMATISTISFIVAGVGAGVGVASWLLNKPETSASPTTGVRVTPYVGLGSLGATGTF